MVLLELGRLAVQTHSNRIPLLGPVQIQTQIQIEIQIQSQDFQNLQGSRMQGSRRMKGSRACSLDVPGPMERRLHLLQKN